VRSSPLTSIYSRYSRNSAAGGPPPPPKPARCAHNYDFHACLLRTSSCHDSGVGIHKVVDDSIFRRVSSNGSHHKGSLTIEWFRRGASLKLHAFSSARAAQIRVDRVAAVMASRSVTNKSGLWGLPSLSRIIVNKSMSPSLRPRANYKSCPVFPSKALPRGSAMIRN